MSLTSDARLIGLVSAATLLPWLVVGPVGGAIVDRTDRRRLMIAGQLGRGVLALVLVALIAVDALSVWALVPLAFGLGVGEILVDAPSQAAIPLLVDPGDLDRANGRVIAAMTILDQVLGVAVGASLFAVAAGLPFAVDGLTFVLGAALMTALPAVLAASYFLNAAASSPWVVAAAFFVANFAIVCFNVPGQSIRQSITPEHLLGRVVTSYRMFGTGAAPLGAILGGFITQATNVRAANVVAGVVAIVSGAVLIAALRHLDEATPNAA